MFDRLQRFISGFVTFVGAAVLAGWWLGIAPMRSIAPGLPEMVPNTALAFVLAGLSLRAHVRIGSASAFVARACACAIVLLGLLTSLEYVSGINLRIDRLLMPDRTGVDRGFLIGRMSPHTAANFVLAGTASLLATTNKRRMIHASQMLAAAAAAIALVALVGYVYGVTVLYGISPQTGMALHTALLFLILSAGVLLLHPARGVMRVVTGAGLGGIVARRLLAAAFVVPLVLGWLSVLGQQAGLYDAAISSSLLVVGSIVIFSALIWSGARTLDRIDNERRIAEEGRARLLRRVIDAQEEERRRLARELHDQIGQHLAALTLQLELHRADVGTDAGDGGNHLRQVHELADRLAHEAHTLAWELRPPELDQLGLQAALSRYAEQWSRRAGVKADFVATGLTDNRLRPEIEIALYRVVQEALTNVLKHAAASNVSVIVERKQTEVLVVVEDDGGGFDANAVDSSARSRLGVLGMRERIDAVGGTLDIESSPGAGTTFVVRIPLTQAALKQV